MIRTAWILSAYDPAKNPVAPPEKPTMHAHVLACLYADVRRIADIAKQIKRSETYVQRLLDDLIHFGVVGKRRMPGKGMRMEFYPHQETT